GQTLAGKPLLALDRRAKYLLWRFEHGTLISHLGMSGSWRLHLHGAPRPGSHDHDEIEFSAATGARKISRLTDPRPCCDALWYPSRRGDPARHPLLAHLGLEPFDPRFDAGYLHAATRGRRIAIKQVLLSGAVVVGVGNIYASECLFRAGIHP